MRRAHSVWMFTFAAIMSACCQRAFAVEHGQALAQMDHTMWTARDGAPQAITALAQATDGTLWVGSDSGLFSFDGRTFSAFQSPPGDPVLPRAPVLSIRVARNGSLWVGFLFAGAARIERGHVTLYANADSLLLTTVRNLSEAPDGGMWAVGNNLKPIRLGKDGAWHLEPAPAATRISGIFIDSSNTLWLAQGQHLHRRPLSQAAYTDTKIPADFLFGFSQASDGGIWMVDVDTDFNRGRAQRIDPLGNLVTALPLEGNPSGIIQAPDGSLIVSFQSLGVRRFSSNEILPQASTASQVEPDTFSTANGLSSDRTAVQLLDSDGVLWIGGLRGLDRLTTARLTPFMPGATPGRWSVCANQRGDLWVVSTSGELRGMSADGSTSSYSNVGDAFALACPESGNALAVIPTAILDVRRDGIRKLPMIPNLRPYQLVQVLRATNGTLYARLTGAGDNNGTWRYRDGEWTMMPGETALGTTSTIAYVDAQDRLWSGYGRGKVSLRDGNGSQVFSSGDPGLGTVLAILGTTRGMLAAGLNGVAALRGPGFAMLAFEDEAAAHGVRGLVESRNGDLWLNAARGIVHVTAGELEKGLADPAYRMKAELIAEGEFAGAAQGNDGRSATAARDARGHLWFATRSGVVRLDPDQRSTSRPPVMTIRSIAADGRLLNERGMIDPRPQTLSIQYRGVNLVAPDKVVYRYRLEPLEESWQDAGHRSEAIYTRLPPGTYVFHASASNGDGLWTTPVSSSSFTVLPSFYQTMWFALLCALIAAALAWLFFGMRVRAITRVVRARAEERADERIRIARELHDTLLQGIQGLLLTFHVATQKMPSNDEPRVMLERALSTAERIIVEGRNRVGSLRSEHVTDGELVGAVQNAANDLDPDHKVVFRVTRSGIDAKLHRHVSDEVFFMAREALANAFRHAEASRISIELDWGHRFFTLLCQDDGRGFGPQERERAGHWGLQGIEERARKLGGQVSVRSEPQRGTLITIVIPSYHAYVRHSRLMFYLRAWRLSERNPLNRART